VVEIFSALPKNPIRVDYPSNVGENEFGTSLDPNSSGFRHFCLQSWACGAAGSALPWHGRGRRFDPDQVHQNSCQLTLPSTLATIQLASDVCPRSSSGARKKRNATLVKMIGRRTIPIGLFLLVCSFFFSVLPAAAANWTVRAQPARLINGGPVLFQVKPPMRLESLHGTWLGHEVSFSFDAASKTWYALAGVSLETSPGTYSLELSGETPTGKAPGSKIAFTRKFAVAAGKYPKIKVKLSVEGKFTEPDPEQQKQIAEGVQVKKDYLSRVTPEREWSGQFAAPANAAISDVFGSERIFNGKTSSPHLGLDFRVPSGTPVAAMNDGTVLLARPLYFEGNFVVIDHGQGLLTLYLHLSEFKVKEGDQVKRGQIIGLSGGTGRATGPHLHVAVRWQGTYLDPAQLILLHLPQSAVGISN
jgi:murein DD-endopeptidase MepM/ murein hydrolase activator NlpD